MFKNTLVKISPPKTFSVDVSLDLVVPLAPLADLSNALAFRLQHALIHTTHSLLRALSLLVSSPNVLKCSLYFGRRRYLHDAIRYHIVVYRTALLQNLFSPAFAIWGL